MLAKAGKAGHQHAQLQEVRQSQPSLGGHPHIVFVHMYDLGSPEPRCASAESTDGLHAIIIAGLRFERTAQKVIFPCI